MEATITALIVIGMIIIAVVYIVIKSNDDIDLSMNVKQGKLGIRKRKKPKRF